MNPNGHHWIRDNKRAKIYARDNHRCLWCYEAVTPGETATLDHFLPRSLGGHNYSTNVFTACVSCNSSRGDTPALLFGCYDALERIFESVASPVEVPGILKRAGVL